VREEQDRPGSGVHAIEAVERVDEVAPVAGASSGRTTRSRSGSCKMGSRGRSTPRHTNGRPTVSVLQVLGVPIMDDLPIVSGVKRLEPVHGERVEVGARCKGGASSGNIDDGNELGNPGRVELSLRRRVWVIVGGAEAVVLPKSSGS